MAVRSDTSKRLGALLLKGWAMLAEECPHCQVPLMKERGAEERLCVNCDTTFVVDGQGLRPTSRPNGAEQPGQPASADNQQAGDVGAGGDDDEQEPYDPRSDPRLGPFAASSHSAGAEAGPAEGAAAAGPGAGKAAGDHMDGLGSAAASAPANGVASAQDGAASAGLAQTAPSADEVADRLSARMLQGWALLDKYCPRCSTVLVRSKATKRMFCVACDAWVLTEADRQQQQQAERQEPEQAGRTQQERPSIPSPDRGGSAAAAAALRPHGPVQPQEPSSAAPPAAAPPAAPSQHPQPPQAAAGGQQYGVAACRSSHAAPSGTGAASQLSDLPAPPTSSSRAQQQGALLEAPPPQRHAHAGADAHADSGVAERAEGAVGGVGPGSSGSSLPSGSMGGFAVPGFEAFPPGFRSAPAPQHQPQRSQRSGSSPGPQEGSSSGKHPPGAPLLMSIGRTVALKMAEAQGLLERTPAVDTDKARSYVSLISECLDLLTKLHSLQQ